MRRDLPAWFFAGVVLACALALIIAIASNASLGLTVVIIQLILLGSFVLAFYRRHAWRQACGSARDENFRSHELRCKLLVDDNMRKRHSARGHHWAASI